MANFHKKNAENIIFATLLVPFIFTNAYAQTSDAPVNVPVNASINLPINTPVHAPIPFDKQTTVNYQIGIDHWGIQSAPENNAQATLRGIGDDVTYRELHLPDGSTIWPYRNNSPWATVTVEHTISKHLTIDFKALANQYFGGRMESLSANYALSPVLGFRAGVVDLKLSWCKDYDPEQTWIYDPNEFCSDTVNKQMTASAPGIQTYTNQILGNYRMQAIAGVYNAKLAGYADWENGKRTLTPEKPTDSNDKYGFSINAIHLHTATEYRFSWLHSEIKESPAVLLELGGNVQKNDIIYIASKTNLTKNTSFEINASSFQSNVHDVAYSYADQPYYYVNNNKLKIDNISLNLTYTAPDNNIYCAGYTVSHRVKKYSTQELNFASNTFAEYPELERSNFKRWALAFSWKRNWTNHISSTVEWIRTVLDASAYAGTDQSAGVSTTGNAIGTQISYHF
jgi:hypothetical protein